MVRTASQKIVRRLPGIGWRDAALERRAAQVAELRERVGELREQVGELREQADELGEQVPSFRRNILHLRRHAALLRQLDPDLMHPQRQIARKLRTYQLAQSHGVAVPETLGVWASPEEIEFGDLPQQFVLKADVGSSGRGVVPLRRLGEDRFASISGTEVYTQESLVSNLRARKGSYGPWFAEQFLEQRVAAEEIIDDVKVYAAYGEVLMILLRRVREHDNSETVRYRYLDAEGRDLGADAAPGRRVDSTIPAPEPLGQFLEVAVHLSRSVAAPFIRVDLYDTVDGPVLGELTRSPGGPQVYRSELDLSMGRAWDEAQVRLDLDLARGRPFRNLHGPHTAPNNYPPTHRSQSDNPGGWSALVADCATWCRPAEAPQASRG